MQVLALAGWFPLEMEIGVEEQREATCVQHQRWAAMRTHSEKVELALLYRSATIAVLFRNTRCGATL